MGLTKHQKSVLFYLSARPKDWVGPTEIGEQVGEKGPQTASSWGSAQLRALVNLGLAERDEGQYQITEEGQKAADALRMGEGD